MIDPKVQRHGDVALLTFNLVNYGKLPDAPERVLARWNSTEVYLSDWWDVADHPQISSRAERYLSVEGRSGGQSA